VRAIRECRRSGEHFVSQLPAGASAGRRCRAAAIGATVSRRSACGLAGSVVGIERDQLENDDKFMLHLAQVVRNGLGDRAGTCIDPKTQVVQDKTVCVVSCQRSPEPVFLKWKDMEKDV
jgi:hypothetical protein